jgi:hypothetical protein
MDVNCMYVFLLFITIGLHGDNYCKYICCMGAHGNIVVKALCYKPEGRGFETL